jgi:phosphoglucosamine mutase
MIGNTPNGINVNDGCGSTHIESLCELVKKENLDIGFAFDGDADRCICVDEGGNVIDGDGILYAMGRMLSKKGELPAGIVATLMSNYGLVLSLKRLGIPCTMTQVGDKYVYEEMLRRGAMLGGEQSGHIIFRKYATTGDGILTAVMLMNGMIEEKCPISMLTEGLNLLPQVKCNVKADRAVLKEERVKSAIFRAEKLLGGGGRLVVRASGTEPLIRILAESESLPDCERATREVERAIRETD